MVDVIITFLAFVQKNSCGQCVPCRVGSQRLKEGLETILNEKKKEEIETITRLLADSVGYSSRCDLGKLAGKAVKYALELCYEDFLAHREGGCGLNVPDHSGWDKVMIV